MTITPYSFCMSLIWFSAFVFISDRLYRKTGFLLHYHTGILICLVGLSAVRLFLPLEAEWTKEIFSYVVLPQIQTALRSPFSVGSVRLTSLQLLLAVWLAGSLFFFLRFVVKLTRGRRYLDFLLASAVQEPAVLHCFDAVQTEANRQKACRVVISSTVRVPMITGIMHPTILLPVLVTELSEQDLRHILQHEYCHVLNCDIHLKAFLELLCCVLWWNPVVYLLKNSLGQALEVKCDLRVTKVLGEDETIAYLQTILDVFERVNAKKPSLEEQAAILGADYVGETEVLALHQRLTVVSGYASTKKTVPLCFSR